MMQSATPMPILPTRIRLQHAPGDIRRAPPAGVRGKQNLALDIIQLADLTSRKMHFVHGWADSPAREVTDEDD